MAGWDSMKASLFALIRAALPRVDYYALYYGKVVAWHAATQTVDVQPNDPRVPSISGATLRGPAGFVFSINPAVETSVLIGWENGDPARAFALCAFTPGAHVNSLTIPADMLSLGGDGGEPPPKGVALLAYLTTVATAAGAPPPDPTTLLATNVLVK